MAGILPIRRKTQNNQSINYQYSLRWLEVIKEVFVTFHYIVMPTNQSILYYSFFFFFFRMIVICDYWKSIYKSPQKNGEFGQNCRKWLAIGNVGNTCVLGLWYLPINGPTHFVNIRCFWSHAGYMYNASRGAFVSMDHDMIRVSVS